MATILSDTGECEVQATNGLCVSPADAECATGWTLKPEGMCRGEICVPLRGEMRRDGKVDLAAFWRLLGNPVVHDDPGKIWVLGAGADERSAALADGMAPDFTLPDLHGKPHTLSALRGKKVFLCTWASW
jgi:hypothetical protein